jgi:hypothetical protein
MNEEEGQISSSSDDSDEDEDQDQLSVLCHAHWPNGL